MDCCDDNLLRVEYVPLYNRLKSLGEEQFIDLIKSGYSYTKLWIFSFYDGSSDCQICRNELMVMNQWLESKNYYNDINNNVKWVVEDEPEKNLIFKLYFNRLPCHVFCDSNFNVIDVLYATPDNQWLEDNFIQLVNK